MKSFFLRKSIDSDSKEKEEKKQNITVLVTYEKIVDFAVYNIIYLCNLLNVNECDYENAQCVFLSEIDKELEIKANDFILMHEEETLTHSRYIELIELIVGFSVFKFASNHYGKYIKEIIENIDDIDNNVIMENIPNSSKIIDTSMNLYLHTFSKSLFREKLNLVNSTDIINFLTKRILLKYIKEYAQTFFAKLYGNISTRNIKETDKFMNDVRDSLYDKINEILDREMRKSHNLLII
jgi:hypothetical protein